MAVATDLFYSSVTKLFGSVQHVRQQTVNLPLVKQFALGSLPGAAASILLLKTYPPLHAYQDTIIRNTLGIMLIVVALLNLVKLWLGDEATGAIQDKPLEGKLVLTISIGFVLGFLVGLTSIGSGSLFALAMMFFYRLTAAELVGTDIVHAFLLVSAAGLMHAGLGHIHYGLAFQLLIGSVPGVYSEAVSRRKSRRSRCAPPWPPSFCSAASSCCNPLTSVPWTLFAIGTGAILLFSIGLATATVGFWITRIAELQNFTEDAARTAAQYPLALYPKWLQSLLLVVVPVGFVSYVPSLYIVRGEYGVWLLAGTALAALLCLAGSLAFWRYGLTKY